MTFIIDERTFSAIAIALTIIAFYPFIRAILKGKSRPHVFSWFIWAGVTFTVATAQFAGGAGVGSWPLALSGLLTGGVALLALSKSADTSIYRSAPLVGDRRPTFSRPHSHQRGPPRFRPLHPQGMGASP